MKILRVYSPLTRQGMHDDFVVATLQKVQYTCRFKLQCASLFNGVFISLPLQLNSTSLFYLNNLCKKIKTHNMCVFNLLMGVEI